MAASPKPFPSDIKQVKETRKLFEKISDDMDNALIRNGNAPRTKLHECEEADNLLKATRGLFGHTSLDYVYQVCRVFIHVNIHTCDLN